MTYTNRTDAGRRLATEAAQRLDGDDVVVLGLPRGGVPVAYELATALAAPLDVIVVRKIGVPFQPELAMGAIGEDRARVVDARVMSMAGADERDFAAVEERERQELERRVRQFRGDRPRMPLRGRTAVVVDDGIATGSTARAACQVARHLGARRVVVATPVGAPDAVERLEQEADEVICPQTPDDFSSIGQWYTDFTQTSDLEVTELLARAAVRPRTEHAPPSGGVDEEVEIQAGPIRLPGHLTVPEQAVGVVVFAHGSGSGRHSPRNREVAEALNRGGLGTLLFDLLSEAEAENRDNVFDIGLLAGRLAVAAEWVRERPETAKLPVGYFGASTGAAAALAAAAEPRSDVQAVVSRGGRPDLAGEALESVRAATLLIVGGDDPHVLDLNRQAQARLRCEHRLTVIPGATHLFEEPGALTTVAELARDWFTGHLARAPRPVRG
ncbi:dienelactone hydrolase family protein [Thermobifida halotolerans]|uniref:Dienelactone hydrolase family protein n=1 Tax=Thermobifida halotolerans TaxID=483545 RepID=A0AA97M0N2_9ACTN|nr:phosphoribosyltransferase family protein [Thermobifida halotolerans]UOE21528.1 dienelactone hydrolase family protein [Thermobifida halotolerans]